jgi:hypothetical protein
MNQTFLFSFGYWQAIRITIFLIQVIAPKSEFLLIFGKGVKLNEGL